MKATFVRPTFATAAMWLHLFVFLSLFFAPAFAMPQFGYPFFRALDGVTTTTKNADGQTKYVPVAAGPGASNQVLNSHSSDGAMLAQNSTSGAPRAYAGLGHGSSGLVLLGHVPTAFVVSAAASAAFLVF